MSKKENNRTEQWLKAYAAKRREQLGEEPDMHEATRQMLQGEVRRTWGQPAMETESAGGWQAFVFRWAIGGTVALGVGLLAIVILNGPSANRPGNLTDNNSGNAKIAKVEKQKPALGERNKENDAEEAENLRNAKSAGGFTAAAEKETADASKIEDAATGKLSERALRARSAKKDSATVAKPGLAAMRAASPYSNMNRNFAQTPQRDSNVQNVMQNIVVTRNNDLITIKDEDGSIYRGRVMIAGVNLPMLAAGTGDRRQGNDGLNTGGGQNAGQGGGAGTSGNAGRRPSKPPIQTRPPGSTSPAAKDKPKAPPVQPAVPLIPAKAPPNDMMANSLKITDDDLKKGPIFGHNILATSEGGREDIYHNFQGKSVWWNYSPSQPGEMSISTRGSNFDTTLGVFVANAGQLAANEGLLPAPTASPFWNDNAGNVPQSKLLLTCETGKKYLIVVDGKGGSTGKIKLSMRFKASPTVTMVQPQRPLFYFRVNGMNKATGLSVDFDGFMYQQIHRSQSFSVVASSKEEGKAKAGNELKRLEERKSKAQTMDSFRIQGRAQVGGQELPVKVDTIITPVPVKKASNN